MEFCAVFGVTAFRRESPKYCGLLARMALAAGAIADHV